jgi:hypothetical protein
MSLLNTFRSLPIMPLRRDMWDRWLSELRSLRPSDFLNRRNPELIPAMGTVLLLVAVGLQLTLPSISPLPEQTELAPRRAREPLPPAVPNYPAVLNDPIFAPDRKADASIEPPAGGMNDYSVLGIATAGAGIATAVVKSPDGTITRIQPGADLDGWKLIQVDLDALTFEKNGERHILAIEKKPALPTLTAPGNGAAAPAGGNGQ